MASSYIYKYDLTLTQVNLINIYVLLYRKNKIKVLVDKELNIQMNVCVCFSGVSDHFAGLGHSSPGRCHAVSAISTWFLACQA